VLNGFLPFFAGLLLLVAVMAATSGLRQMLKGFLRFFAGVLLLVAVMAATNDVTRSLTAGHAVAPVSALEHWSGFAPVTLDIARKAVQRGTHPLIWDMGVAKALQLPTWALFGLLAALLAYLGRRRREINIYAN
jgi:hypothetical protein